MDYTRIDTDAKPTEDIDDRDVFDDIEIDEGGFLTPVRG